ncbi:MAG: MraY family glycosyltransferase [candidate division FCPU426 bacterium]
MLTSLVALAAAAAVTFLLTPPARRLAERLQVLDRPDRQRKRHRRLTPLWGGAAVAAGLALGVTVATVWTPVGRALAAYRQAWLGRGLWWLLAAAVVMTLAGLWDDRRPLPPKVKLLAQLLSTALVLAAGFHLQTCWVWPFGIMAIWPWLGFLLAWFWLLVVTNAFNFIDGLDGLASSQAFLGGIWLCLGAWRLATRATDLAAVYQYVLAGVLAAAVAGAALGFWRFNRHPAKIFLGEAGSALLGLGLGIAALLLLRPGLSPAAPWFVALALAWPLADATQVTIRRWRRGLPVSKADNRHGHHYLLAQDFSPGAAVALIFTFSLLLGLAGLLIIWWA